MDALHFYYSKFKLLLQLVFFMPLMVVFLMLFQQSIVELSLFGGLIFLPLSILFTSFFLSALLRLLRPYPYITFTADGLILNPHTWSEIKLDYTEIASIEISETSFQKSIELILRRQNYVYNQFSRLNKIRLGPNQWFGYQLLMINPKMIARRDRTEVLAVIDNMMTMIAGQLAEGESILNTNQSVVKKKTVFYRKYDQAAPRKFIVDGQYLLRACGHSLLIFAFLTISALLIGGVSNYLIYVTLSLFAFPFAKLLTDAMGIYKFRQGLERQKGPTYYYWQFKLFMDLVLFHVSIYLAPFGLIYLVIRKLKTN